MTDGRMEIDIYPVEYGPNKGKLRWVLIHRGTSLESGHEDSEPAALAAASEARRRYEQGGVGAR
jgi:hypothetical protein